MDQPKTQQKRPQIACLTNILEHSNHGERIIDRLLEGYDWGGTWHPSSVEVVSLWVDQRGIGEMGQDLTAERAERHPEMKVCPTIYQALTRDTGKLAVDGVVYVGEQGAYPKNEKGQTLYPRYQVFEQIVDVYKSSGRSVPTYNDKHLSWNWDWAKDMYDTSRRMGFPFQAGSNIPLTWRMPQVDMPLDASVREAICVGAGGVDSYDFHALEAIQCMVERRKGGETGVEWLQAYRGDNFWKAHEQGVWSPALFKAALCRSRSLASHRPSFTNVLPTPPELKAMVKDPIAYHYQYKDGLKATILLMAPLVREFNFAATIEGEPHPLSTEMYQALSIVTDSVTDASYYDAVAYYIEQMILTGKQQRPLERTLLTSGLVIAGVDSLFRGQQRIETPWLDIHYQPMPSNMRRT